jgi:hypothetical protein
MTIMSIRKGDIKKGTVFIIIKESPIFRHKKQGRKTPALAGASVG